MELDDLKNTWKIHTGNTVNELMNDDQLLVLLRGKATNVIEKLIKSVRFELWFSVIFITLCIYFAIFSKDIYLQNAALVVIIISFGFIYFYYKKFKLLKSLSSEDKNIRENLSYFIERFEKYLRFYKIGYSILIPVALLSGALLGIYSNSPERFPLTLYNVNLWLVLLTVLIPLTLGFNYLLRWYLKNLYGNYLAKLKSYLIDLQEQ